MHKSASSLSPPSGGPRRIAAVATDTNVGRIFIMIMIAGAGIGGLTLGCALARAGRPFRIIERSERLRPAGAGIALSANALRALAYIGLDDIVRASGHEVTVAAICDPNGRALLEVPVHAIVPGGTIALERERLHQALQRTLGVPVSLGRAVIGYESRADGVRVRIDGGETLEADLLVGADGLHSAVRRVMRGEEALRYSGQTSWRAIAGQVDTVQPDRFTESWGADQRFGIVPLGRQRVYWFAVMNAPQGGRDAGDPREALRARFAGWHAPIDELLAATRPEVIIRTDIFDRPPIKRWTDGRGSPGRRCASDDPGCRHGGGQAIEDAVVLAGAIAGEVTIEAGLARYEAKRLARANGFVKRSYRVGQVAHLRARPLRWLRDRALQRIPLGLIARSMARDFDFQP
jgi:2-polyprenyl-6-methoxyphenol hydroxylase-like FAD-dependent oxidoreductase